LLEPAFGGSLDTWLPANFPKGLSHVDDGLLAQLIFAQLVLAVKRIHQEGIVHADYKPANLMINKKVCKNLKKATCKEQQGSNCTASQKWMDNECAIKLIDYGMACVDRPATRKLPRLYGCVQERKGTPAFMDPNAHEGGLTKPSADIWALGVTLYWLLFNKHLFADKHGMLNPYAIHYAPTAYNCYWPSAPLMSYASSVCHSTLRHDGILGNRTTAEQLWTEFKYVSEDARYWALNAESLEVGAIGHDLDYQPPQVILDAVMPPQVVHKKKTDADVPFSTWALGLWA